MQRVSALAIAAALVKLDTSEDVLGSAALPAGHDTQVRLVVQSTTTMLIGFDGNQSIHATGNGRYMMSPVITIMSVN